MSSLRNCLHAARTLTVLAVGLVGARAFAQDFDISVQGNAGWEWAPDRQGLNDPLYRRIWVRSEKPIITGADVNCAHVRDMALLKDKRNRPFFEDGKYVTYFWGRQLPSGYIDTYRAESYDLDNWFNFKQVLAHGTLGLDQSYAGVGTVLRVGAGDYRMWYQAKAQSRTATNIALATSTDGVNWVKKGVVVSGTNLVDVFDLSVPFVYTLSDGSYVMLAEGNGLSETTRKWRAYGFTSKDGFKWTPLNSGRPLIDVGPDGSWDAGFVANPKLMQTANGFVVMYNGGSDPRSDAACFQIGFATSKTLAGPWVKDAVGPVMGRNCYPANYGLETSCWTMNADGDDWLTFAQDFPGGSRTSSIYRVTPINLPGIIMQSDRYGASVMSQPAPTGKFTALTRSFIGAGRDDVLTPVTLLGLFDSKGVNADISRALKDQRRIEVRRCSGSWSTPGDVSISYIDPKFTEWYWTGTTWVNTPYYLPLNLEDSAWATIQDIGSLYKVTVQFGDDDTVLTTTTIPKTAVRPFSNGRCVVVGDPYLDNVGAQLYVLEATLLPY